LLQCDHKSVNTIRNIKPTCTEDGYTGDTVCTGCGEKITTGEIIPATGHISGEWVIITEPSETTEGLRTKSCTVCSEEIEREVIPIIVPVTVPGDASGDGKINLTDVAMILKYIAKWEVAPNLDTADVTGDGKVNLMDASLILKYIAKWDVTFK